MLDPTAEYILMYMAIAVGIAAFAVLVRAVVGTTSGCMSILLKAVEFGERVKRLFSRQSADRVQHTDCGVAKGRHPSTRTVRGGSDDRPQSSEASSTIVNATPPNLPAKMPADLPPNPLPAERRRVSKGRQDQQRADARVAEGLQPSHANETGPHVGVAKGAPTTAPRLPVTQKTDLPVSSLPVSAVGVARGRQVLGRDSTDQSANAWRQPAEALPRAWRPLATPRPALPAPVILDADAAMKFRIWMLEFGLQAINRGHGELIAGIDLWWLAQQFAAGSGFRIASRDRFFEALRKLPGVHKEEDRRVTRLWGGRQKRVAYAFSPAIVANRKAVGG